MLDASNASELCKGIAGRIEKTKGDKKETRRCRNSKDVVSSRTQDGFVSGIDMMSTAMSTQPQNGVMTPCHETTLDHPV